MTPPLLLRRGLTNGRPFFLSLAAYLLIHVSVRNHTRFYPLCLHRALRSSPLMKALTALEAALPMITGGLA